MQTFWLTFIYKVPSEPSRKRAYVWRHLKQLGAVFMQQAVCLLPNRPELNEALRQLANKVRELEGEATILLTSNPDAGWDDRVIANFKAARDAEYAEVIENIAHFEAEIARESAGGKFTFAELEDVESDFEKIQNWLGRVRARDYFQGDRAGEAGERIGRAIELMESFAEDVYRHEGVNSPGPIG